MAEKSKNSVKLKTIQNIYERTVEEDESVIVLTRSSSSRSRLNKQAYAQLHRHSFTNPGNTSVDKLKGRYERTNSEPTDNELIPSKINRDSVSSEIVQTEDGKNSITNFDENPKSPDNLSKTTTNIEELQNRLSTKLSQETVEKLRLKYSPASFGYPKPPVVPKSPKKVQFSPKPVTKIPVPAPRPRASINNPQGELTSQEKTDSILDQNKTTNGTEINSNVLPSLNNTSANETELKEDTIEPNQNKASERVNLIQSDELNDNKIVLNPNQISVKPQIDRIVDQNKNEEIHYVKVKILTDSQYPQKVISEENKLPTVQEEKLKFTFDEIKFAEPEDKHLIVLRSSSEDSVEKYDKFFSDFEMDKKKRTSSFRKISDRIFGKDKKKENGNKKENNTVFAENAQNESQFDRNSSQRHTVDGHYPRRDPPYYANNHLNLNKQPEKNKPFVPGSQLRYSAEDYVCMDSGKVSNLTARPTYMNVSAISKYIDTSSSSSSDNRNDTYQNALIAQAEMKQLHEREMASPKKFYTNKPMSPTVPVKNFELVNPKAVIPISSERPLPNPYQNNLNKARDQTKNYEKNEKPPIYGSVYEPRGNSPRSLGSPKTVEPSKLRLPPNREKIELQPRIKSPIPQTRVSTDKIIATELLKNKPSHQKLEIDINYPEASEVDKPPAKLKRSPHIVPVRPSSYQGTYRNEDKYNHSPVSLQYNSLRPNYHSTPESDYQKERKVLIASPPPLPIRNPRRAVSVTVHSDAQRQAPLYSNLMPLNRSSPQSSPKKHEIMQNVQAFYWKEMKKLKEKEEQKEHELMYRQMQLAAYGYVEEPVYFQRSRSVSPGLQRGGRRSLSLPRDVKPTGERLRTQHAIPEGRAVVYHKRDEPAYGQLQPNFVRNAPMRNTIGPSISEQKPIFKRGSLSLMPDANDSQILKRVSFTSLPAWPTKNGLVQSPPTRRLEREDDDVFIYTANPNDPRKVIVARTVSQESIRRQNDPRMRQEVVNPVYGSKQSLDYGRSMPKQVTVTDRVCDIYGQIHDYRKPHGVIYGQLQQPQEGNFVRGTRLTASANDMYRRYPGRPVYEQERYYYPESPSRPLPPLPPNTLRKMRGYQVSDTESGSEASEIQRIFQNQEEWNSDGKSGRGTSANDSGGSRGENEGEVKGRSRSARREDPRRHTLAGDQHYGSMGTQGGPLSRTMDLEGQFSKGYPPSSNAMLFDDDPGIMSEVETSSTGFRRGGKQRSSLPVVRTPSKTLERPLGLVFLQYRNETKRALLPNEITSIDTVKALFVRSFPKQLNMEYLDSPLVKIYIHDSSKDMFYELEDVRSHLREIRDRSVLRLFESTDVSGGFPLTGTGIAGGVGHFDDPSYFSEPEFDSEYQHQHIHKSKGSAGKGAPYYMGSTASLPRGPLLRPYSPAVGPLPSDRMKTLPAGAPPKPQRAYNSGALRSSDGSSRPDRFAPFQRPVNPLFNLPDGYMSSPERSSRYEDPYYSQYTSRSGSITPVIDEVISDTELLDESYSLYGVRPAAPRGPRTQFSAPAGPPYDSTRIRVEHMERQLANLTGLVQKALTQGTKDLLQPPGRENYRGDEFDKNSSSSSASLADKSVSFEKSVSFSDEPPDMNSPKQHSPQHAADTKPPKPAIKSSTLPRTYSQEKDRLKPAPPPKPASLSPGQYDGRHIYRDLQLTPEMYNQLRGLQKKAKDLRAEVRNLRRMSQAQAHSVRETIRDTFIKIRAMLLAGGEQVWQAGMDQERMRLSREEDLYKQEMIRLETDLSDLESAVEELRGNVINRKTRVNMSDVENMALVLSKSSKTVADLKLRFPGLQDGMKAFLSSEMEKVMREEKFLKEEPERLESALRRCKKLTGTLVTLKRLASVQEQRLPCSTSSTDGRLSPNAPETPPITPTSAQHGKPPSGLRMGQVIVGGDGSNPPDSNQRPENALDALLDELQTFSKPHQTVNTQMPQTSYSDSTPSDPPALPIKGISASLSGHHITHLSEIGRKGSMDSASVLPTQNLTVSTTTGSLRRLHSYPSGSDTDNSPPIQPIQRIQVDAKAASKPPIPERNIELLQHIAGKRIPPPPPPRTSSKSPLASPTSPSLPPRSPAAGLQHIQNVQNMLEKPLSQFEAATQNLGLGTLRRNVANRSSLRDKSQTLPRNIGSNLQVQTVGDNSDLQNVSSSSCESVNSQDGTKKVTRKEELEQRHQELLKKQKALQEQYARLQQLQRGNNTLAIVPPPPDQLLKKTGSESNLLQKMGLQMTAQQMSGSLTHLPTTSASSTSNNTNTNTSQPFSTTEMQPENNTTINKVYETDIL